MSYMFIGTNGCVNTNKEAMQEEDFQQLYSFVYFSSQDAQGKNPVELLAILIAIE